MQHELVFFESGIRKDIMNFWHPLIQQALAQSRFGSRTCCLNDYLRAMRGRQSHLRVPKNAIYSVMVLVLREIIFGGLEFSDSIQYVRVREFNRVTR